MSKYEINEALEWRFIYHPPKDVLTQTAHENIRGRCLVLARVFDQELPEGREKSLAMTNLEQAMFWANASIARQKDN